MTIISAFFVFLVIWWLIFLPMLSIGVRNQHEAGDNRIQGTDPGAPAKTDMKRKIILTSVISFVLTVIAMFVVNSGVLGKLI